MEFLDIQVNIECGFFLKYVRDIIITYHQMHRTDKYSQLSSVIWSVLRNGWVFVYKLSGCGFQSSCSHLIFRCRTCFMQRVPWHSGKYRLWIHFEIRALHNINIPSKVSYREVLIMQIIYFVSFPKWLSVRLRTKWFWDQVQLQWLNVQISCLLRTTNSLTFTQIYSVDSLINASLTW